MACDGLESKLTSYQAAVGFFALLKVPAVAADEEVACGWGDSNAGERRNLEGRARPVFVVCIIPSRPLLLLACIVILQRRESLTHHERTCRRSMTAQRLTHSASIRHAYQPFPIPYCISLLDRGAALGTYLYIIMAALPEVVASLLTSGPVERDAGSATST